MSNPEHAATIDEVLKDYPNDIINPEFHASIHTLRFELWRLAEAIVYHDPTITDSTQQLKTKGVFEKIIIKLLIQAHTESATSINAAMLISLHEISESPSLSQPLMVASRHELAEQFEAVSGKNLAAIKAQSQKRSPRDKPTRDTSPRDTSPRAVDSGPSTPRVAALPHPVTRKSTSAPAFFKGHRERTSSIRPKPIKDSRATRSSSSLERPRTSSRQTAAAAWHSVVSSISRKISPPETDGSPGRGSRFSSRSSKEKAKISSSPELKGQKPDSPRPNGYGGI